MAMTLAEVTIIAASTAIAPGGTEASPVAAGTGGIVGPFADYANAFSYRITNGASAPGVALTIVFYGVRSDGTLEEIDRVSGTTNSSTTEVSNGVLPPSGVIPCPPGFAKFTARAFANTTNAVGAEVFLHRQVP
jgi:hypothetical protein